jgi:hypothetical protein
MNTSTNYGGHSKNTHEPAVDVGIGPRRWSRYATAAILSSFCVMTGMANAADSAGCEGGGFTILNRTAPQDIDVAANTIPQIITVRGKYVEFDIDANTFAVRNYVLTGAPNPIDITGGVRTPVFQSKVPDHKGLFLNSAVELRLRETELVIQREGPGLTMKVQAKDCAQGGLFQMEVERDDQKRTLFTHVLAPSAFYFDNRKFREREGDTLPYKDTTVVVSPRVNFANDVSKKFVGRDSPQVADRVPHPECTNNIVTRTGSTVEVQHCGGVSQWLVASGGRMGQVMGEDSVEVAPPATVCTRKCQAQNRVRGQAVVLGFPYPVPDPDRFKPRLPNIPSP